MSKPSTTPTAPSPITPQRVESPLVLPREDDPVVPAPVEKQNIVEMIELLAEVAALAIRAYHCVSGYALDVNGNEAQKQSDGSIRMSIIQKEGGHKRVYVTIPSTLSLEVRPKSE